MQDKSIQSNNELNISSEKPSAPIDPNLIKDDAEPSLKKDTDTETSKYDNLEQVSIQFVNNSRKVLLPPDKTETFPMKLKCIETSNPCYDVKTVKKRRKKIKKAVNKKRKTVDKIDSHEYDSPIVQVLGYRNCNQIKEMLVLFENGTSNWIVSDNKLTTDNVYEYLQHEDQDLSIINRLGYYDFTTNNSVIYDSDESINDASDSDDVFYKTVSSVSRISNSARPGDSLFSRIIPEVNGEMLSESDLNSLCNYVMSSKHTKIYPSEMNKTVVVKHDGDFCNIFLKRLGVKNTTKKKEFVDLKSCEKMINTLEDCAVDNQCKVVVINGIEEFFASNSAFEKLLKKTPAHEGKKYDQDVSTLRYICLFFLCV